MKAVLEKIINQSIYIITAFEQNSTFLSMMIEYIY